MKVIKTNKGQEIILDLEDYELYKNKTVYINGGGYACFWRDGREVILHREIMQPKKDKVIDHINGNKLDNRKCNLRECTQQQNRFNSKKTNAKTSASKYKGVRVRASRKGMYYETYIAKDGIEEFLGGFKDEIAAANAYNHRAKELFGEYARLNKVPYMTIEEVEDHRGKPKSKYRGVCWDNVNKKWFAYICANGKTIYLGRHPTEVECALAYNKKAVEIFGENYHKLNIIDERGLESYEG